MSLFFVGLILSGCQTIPGDSGQASLIQKKAPRITSTTLQYGTYTAVVERSQLLWEGNKLVGGGHQGFVPLKSGTLKFKKGEASGKFILDMAKLQATDTDSEGLLNHLKADDFFDTVAYPESVFVVQGLTPSGEGMILDGTLQVKSFAKDIQFLVTPTIEEGNVHFVGSTVLDRNDWDIGNALLKDEIPVKIDMVLEKK